MTAVILYHIESDKRMREWGRIGSTGTKALHPLLHPARRHLSYSVKGDSPENFWNPATVFHPVPVGVPRAPNNGEWRRCSDRM